MTTLSAWLALLAVIVAAVGLVLTARLLHGPRQLVGLVSTLVATIVTGWFAWYASIQV